MLNQVVLVGRLVDKITLNENEKNEKNAEVTLAVPRAFKNENGEYETDFIKCVLWNAIAENTAEYCRKGDLIGIKGRLQTQDNKTQVIAEKVSFLSSGKKKEEE